MWVKSWRYVSLLFFFSSFFCMILWDVMNDFENDFSKKKCIKWKYCAIYFLNVYVKMYEIEKNIVAFTRLHSFWRGGRAHTQLLIKKKKCTVETLTRTKVWTFGGSILCVTFQWSFPWVANFRAWTRIHSSVRWISSHYIIDVINYFNNIFGSSSATTK